RDKDARFTALLHHVSLERLVMAYWALSPKAAPGVDGVTWADYGQDLVANLRDLHDRVHSGRYRARPTGYTPGSAEHQVGLMAHLSRWLESRGLGPADLTPGRAEEFLQARRA